MRVADIFLSTLFIELKIKTGNTEDGKRTATPRALHYAPCRVVQLAREWRERIWGEEGRWSNFLCPKFLVSRPFLVNYSPTILRCFLAGLLVPLITRREYRALLSSIKYEKEGPRLVTYILSALAVAAPVSDR